MACIILEGDEGHRILTKGTPTRTYRSKEEGQTWGIVPHYGFLALVATRTRDALLHAPGPSIQRQLQLAGCRGLQLAYCRHVS